MGQAQNIRFPCARGMDYRASELAADMKKFNVAYAAVSCLSKNIQRDNNTVANALKELPGRIIGLAHVDPSAGDEAIDEIDRCLETGFRGIKLHPYYDGYNAFDLNIVSPVLEKASKERLPVLFHTGTPPMTLPIHIGYLAQQFPDVVLICGHMGGWDSMLESIPAVRMAENVYLDTACAGAAKVVELIIKKTDPARVLWGSDVPYGNFLTEFYKLMSLDLPEEQKQMILFDNAAKVYGIH